MIQKATGMGNWWLAASSQRAHWYITSYAEFFWWNIKSARWLSPPQPRFGTLRLLAFPKTKITFEREEISGHWWDSGKYDRAADGNWENYVGTEASLSYVQCFWFLVSSSINISIFHITWLDTFWTDLICVFVCTNTWKMSGGINKREDSTDYLRVGRGHFRKRNFSFMYCFLYGLKVYDHLWFS